MNNKNVGPQNATPDLIKILSYFILVKLKKLKNSIDKSLCKYLH